MHLSARRTYFVQQLPDAACAIADEHNAMIANADLTLISKYSKATTRIAPDCNHETANLLSWLIGAHGVGIDINSIRIAEAKENAKKAGVEKLVWFEENDLFDADIREATAVTLFLPNSVNEKLRPKLLKDLKPGTRVVANAFGRGDWRPDQEMNVADPVERFSLGRKLFLWTIPKRKRKAAHAATDRRWEVLEPCVRFSTYGRMTPFHSLRNRRTITNTGGHSAA